MGQGVAQVPAAVDALGRADNVTGGGSIDDDSVLSAAGGVVVRRQGGEWVVALVHRPKYDDWTIPKGKLDPGEGDVDGALREVEEETGLACRAGRELASTRYRDRGGRPKLVRYWLMVPRRMIWPPKAFSTSEVDELAWLEFDEAAERLTYDRDREVLESCLPGLEEAVSEIGEGEGT